MSPLAALLALACAAPLAVLAQKIDRCTTTARGEPSHLLIDVLPSQVIPKYEQNVDIDIIDKCRELPLRYLVGVAVTVCDDKEPFVDIAQESPPYSPVRVRRTGNATDDIEVYIIQYCQLLL